MAADDDIKDTRISKSASVLPANAVESVPYVDFRTLNAVLQASPEVFYGTFVGQAVDVDVDLPFDPAQVEIINESSLARFTHLPTLAAGEAFRQITDGTLSLVGADAITLGAKGERKFTAGSAVQSDTDVIHYIAIGSRGVGGSA
jgi:hypothetical protein